MNEANPRGNRGGLAAAAGVLLLTAVLGLLWSHARLMWNDEFLSFYSDSVQTLGGVLRVQMHSPISLDPPTYHLLSHLSMDVAGRNGMALRLPALFGFLLLELSLFLLVRRLAGWRAGLIAMSLPLCTASFRYAVEGRPYGLLLGLYAAAVLCWLVAAEWGEQGRPRGVALLGLWLSIALAITSHYFGLLILLPVSTGEAVRSLRRGRFDWPVVGTLVAGMASIALILPGKAALAPYQRHYYTSAVNLHNVSQGYRELFVRYNTWPLPAQKVCAAMLAVATLALVWATVRYVRSNPAGEERMGRDLKPAFWAAMLALAVLPFFGYLFGEFVTHTMEVRYVIAALIPFAVSLALLLERRLRSNGFFLGTISALLVLAVALGAIQIRAEQRKSDAILAAMAVPASLHDELASHPGKPLYTQSLGDFFLDGYYAPDPLVRQRITLLYDEPTEVKWLRHNTNAVTAVNLQQFSPLHIASYSRMLAEPDALLLNYHSGWEWIGDDLRARATPVRALSDVAGASLMELNADGDR
ncbi:glycosyltransferase family 39 protein [Terriglobus aquaticus]|uniref:Glycosyltransferase family 39 protein n=1 Tax=Terriglobus aquaticus TaxID=940139 RepID=A0ABW9KNH9_9BACT|nr:glycosyltransferase family 39 protein [Terriglobus aquaticus]